MDRNHPEQGTPGTLLSSNPKADVGLRETITFQVHKVMTLTHRGASGSDGGQREFETGLKQGSGQVVA